MYYAYTFSPRGKYKNVYNKSACEKLKVDLKNSVMAGDNPEIDNIKLPYLKSIII